MIAAWFRGMRRVAGAPAILAGVYLMTLLLALPLGLALRGMIAGHLGASAEAAEAARGAHYDWWQEFAAQAAGLGETFTPSIVGFAAVLDNVSGVLDNTRRAVVLAGAGTAYVLIWIFLIGGILDRYARAHAIRAPAFFAAAGSFFFRFLRLGVLAAAAYYVLFGLVHGWLFDGLYEWAIRDVTVERQAFVLRVGLYMVFGALLVAVNLVFDYAKIRAVVEDRHSMIAALAAGGRFVARRPAATLGLYLLNGLALVAVWAIYALVAPGAATAGVWVWIGFLVGQVYLLARLAIKLLFYASQTAYFQGELAHAGYVAAPAYVHAPSPAAEAISGASSPAT